METFARHDAGRIQSGTDFETNTESASWLDAIVRIEIVENANKVFGSTMAQDEYEDNQCHLRKG